MLLTQFIRDRSDVELVRLVNSPKWARLASYREYGVSYEDAPGCLLCNTFDTRADRISDSLWDSSGYKKAHGEFEPVESFYMLLALRRGNAPTGAMIRRLAQRELGRRGMKGFKPIEVGTFIHSRMEQHA